MKYVKQLFIVTAASLLLTGIAACDFEAHDDDDENAYAASFSRLDVAPVENKLYREECGSCHFAYQPGLLPARSWQKMMAGLEDHFGENAELEVQPRTALTEYLMKNAAEHSNYKRSRKILASLNKEETPMRISETRYFVRKHHELSKSMVQGNPKVGSYSACAACHVNADKGSYSENEIRIPGFGRWED